MKKKSINTSFIVAIIVFALCHLTIHTFSQQSKEIDYWDYSEAKIDSYVGFAMPLSYYMAGVPIDKERATENFGAYIINREWDKKSDSMQFHLAQKQCFNFFISELPNKEVVEYKGTRYFLENIETKFDSLLIDALRKNTFFKPENCSWDGNSYLPNDLRERINHLENTKYGYFSEQSRAIQKEIQEMKNGKVKIFSIFYFAEHFFKVPEIYESRLFFLERANKGSWESSMKKGDDNSEIENKILIADFCSKWDLQSLAFQLYLNILNNYNSNIDRTYRESIRHKLSDLLNINYDNSYWVNFTGAGLCHTESKDSILIYKSHLRFYEFLMKPNGKKDLDKYELYTILNFVKKAMNYSNVYQVPSYIKLLTYRVIGDYFISQNKPLDLKVARKYYMGLILTILNNQQEYTFSEARVALGKLSWINAKLNDKKSPNFYDDIVLEYAEKKKELFTKQIIQIKKSENLLILNQYRQGIELAKLGISNISLSKLKPYEQNELKKLGYSILIQLYDKINNKDSADFYRSNYAIHEANSKYEILKTSIFWESNTNLQNMIRVFQDKEIAEEELTSKNSDLKNRTIAVVVLSTIIIIGIAVLIILSRKIVKKEKQFREVAERYGIQLALFTNKEQQFRKISESYNELMTLNKNKEKQFHELMVRYSKQVKLYSEKEKEFEKIKDQSKREANILNDLKSSNLQYKVSINDLKKEINLLNKQYSELIFVRSNLEIEIAEKSALTIKSNIHSAISRVLTRCMSHNIGSHVLSKFLDKEQVTVADTLNQYVPFISAEFNQAELIANFNEYLKYRMDYLADIATTTEPVMESPMYLIRDIIKGLDKNRILLNRISGVSSDKKFSLKVFCNGTEIKKDENPAENAADPLISVTNDILGAQAFYIILENIIRNIYKHGNPTNSFDIIINVAHSETDRSFYEVSIYDTNYKSKSSIDAIVGKRNETFNDSVLHDNKLRDSNLGTIEMAVSASYLRCLPIDSCNSEKFRKIENHQENESEANPENRLIYAYTHHNDNFSEEKVNDNSYALGYRFFISKPKQVLVVSKGDFTLTGEHDDLKNKGILAVKPEEINNSFISNHQFIYFDKGVKDVITIQNQSTLPKRIVNFNESISTDTAESFISGLWSQYSKEKYLKYNRISFKNGKREPVLDFSSNMEEGKEYKVFIDNHDERWGCRNCIEITEQCTNVEFKKSKSKEADSLQLKTGTISLANHSANNICQPLGKYDFYDMACGHSKISKLLRSGLLSDINLQYEYAENVFTRIIVIDERIQQNIAFEPKRTYAGRMPFYDYFQQQKIFIPGKDEANLNTETFGQLNDNQQSNVITEADRIRIYIQRHIEEATFCIIHLGILEKMLKSVDNKTIENVDPIIEQLFPNPEHRKKLVITSGRGGALNIPPDLSFIPLALLQNALETLFDKFVLTKILYNSRKCK